MRIIEFNLTMPGRGSWNNAWSGDGNLYSVVRHFTDKRFEELNIDKLLDKRNFYYNWSDGWCANVCVKEIDTKEEKQIKKHTKGFCGYDWMIDSILKYSDIRIVR